MADRALAYGEAAAERTGRNAHGYGERATQQPSSGSPRRSDRGEASSADPQAAPELPPGAQGLHDAATLAAFNALTIGPLGLQALSAIPIVGQRLVPARASRAFRAMFLARAVHALGEPDSDPLDIPIVASLFRPSEPPPASVPVQWLLRVLGTEAPPRARVPGEDRLLPYDPGPPFELIRQLAAAAEAEPGTRWEVGWHGMADAFSLLFGPDPVGPRLLGGRMNRPGGDLLAIVGRFRASVADPGVARGRGAVLTALQRGGLVLALQDLRNVVAAANGGQGIPPIRIPNARHVVAHGEAYLDDLDELARLTIDLVRPPDGLIEADPRGVSATFVLLLRFLPEAQLQGLLPDVVRMVTDRLANRYVHRSDQGAAVQLGILVAALQAALDAVIDGPPLLSGPISTVGAVLGLIRAVPKVAVPIAVATWAIDLWIGELDVERLKAAETERATALARIGDHADARAREVILDGPTFNSFVGLRLLGTNSARRAFDLPTI